MPKELNSEEIARLEKLNIWEKINAGDWYQYGKETELQKIVKTSSQRVQTINALAQTDFDAASARLHEFVPNLADGVEIYFPISSIEYPERLLVGEGSFINSGLQIVSAGRVSVGKHCFIGPNCQLFTPNHHATDKFLRRAGWQYDAPITIGDDCWFGGSVIILPGVSIGKNVVIGAGSVVTRNLPDNCMAAGNPARVLKYFSENEPKMI